MKNILYVFIAGILMFSCSTQNKTLTANGDDSVEKEKPVRIANDSLEYEIIIIDPGFYAYLNRIARPMSYYDQNFLETRNRIYVTEWNNRARNPSIYGVNIYENVIDYQYGVDYGLEVNYKLFWYFQFAQRKYNMRLGQFRLYGPS